MARRRAGTFTGSNRPERTPGIERGLGGPRSSARGPRHSPPARGRRSGTAAHPVARDPDPPLAAIPWRDAVTRIAAEYRRGLIVEAHAVTEDRAWIEQALGTFRAAVFSPDFAEAINESGSTPKSHGYSTSGMASSRSWTTTLTRVMLQHRWVPPDGVCPTVTNGGRRG